MKVYTIEEDDYEATVHAVCATLDVAKAHVARELEGVPVWVEDGPDYWHGRVGGWGRIVRVFEVEE